ncbi:putative bifunctional diguanylate cyclase/phosphodiesterase [Jiella sp. M17.18]|uniref:putative bifunctional diguanylate cyclase/phosphodiesterase n=1 Tax=Jiella sp. M17.18 TaxID=3234247 RepID=UPI0034DEB22D
MASKTTTGGDPTGAKLDGLLDAERAGPPNCVQEERRRFLIASLFASPPSVIISNAVGVLVAFFTWEITGESVFLLLSGLSALVLVGRTATLWRYARIDHAQEDMARLKRWDAEFHLGATSFALLQGLCCFFALEGGSSSAAELLNVIAAIAFASGYVARNAGRPTFVFLQMACLCLPLGVGLALSPRPHYSQIAVFIVLYVLTNIAIVFSLNRNIRALADSMLEARRNAAAAKKVAGQADVALRAMTHGLAMYDGSLALELANERHREIYGADAQDAAPGLLDLMTLAAERGLVTPRDACRVKDLLSGPVAANLPTSLESTGTDGRTFVLRLEPTDGGGVLLVTQDATVEKRALLQIETMARRDRLTGLSNRHELDRRLDALAAEFAAGSSAALIHVDIDNFKNINDTLGHTLGDKVLIAVASRIDELAASADLVARFGGDEFVVVMSGAGVEEAVECGRRILEAMQTPVRADDHTINVRASIGIAAGPDHASNGAQLLAAADLALYEAKGAGRGRVTVFRKEMAASFRRRAELESDMRTALTDDQFDLNYQPIIDLSTGRITAVEALIRWHHPTKGPVSPAEFIPLAERNGLVSDIGDWVIRRACRDLATLPRDVTCAVNVSSVQFADPDRLVAVVRRSLEEHGQQGDRLELELTETVLIEDQEDTRRAMDDLRRLGVRFALDDFGTGYSSIGYLASFQFDKVKIDRSFVERVIDDVACRSVMELVQLLSLQLKFRVVAEGIETAEQLAAVSGIGIALGQGYLFGAALKLPDLIELIRVTPNRGTRPGPVGMGPMAPPKPLLRSVC